MDFSMFEWFKKKAKYSIGVPVICRDNGKAQAILFIFKDLKKHLSFTASKRYWDLHATDDGKCNEHRSIFCFPSRRMKKDIRKAASPEIIAYNSKLFLKMKFIDAHSEDFFPMMKTFDNLPPSAHKYFVPPHKVKKSRRVFAVYDDSNKLQGFIRAFPRIRKAAYCTRDLAEFFKDKYIDQSSIAARLHKEISPSTQSNESTSSGKSVVEKFFDHIVKS